MHKLSQAKGLRWPQALLDWIEGQFIEGNYVNCTYSTLDRETKNSVKQALLKEQGYICCYTGQPIDDNSSHIEHLKPRSKCTDIETVTYTNLLVAYPHNPKGYLNESRCEYGAQAKEDADISVTPLQPDCETRFRFLPSGEIEPRNSIDQEAKSTIYVLVLSHARLEDLRKEVIHEAIFRRLSKLGGREEIIAYLTKLIESIYKLDPENRLRPFCFVIRGVAVDLLQNAT